MKKLILLSVLFAATFSVTAQVVDTTVTSITACKVVPFKAKFSDTSNVTHIGIRSISDDLKSSCQLYFCLLDSSHNVVMQGNRTIGGTDYQNWTGSNSYPFVWLGALLGITYKND